MAGTEQINLQDYQVESKKADGRVKIVSLDGSAYLRIRKFDEGTGRLSPQLIPVSSEGITERLTEIEKDLALHKLLLADVKAAESQPA